MSRNDVWMPLYLGDYLADTMHLNAAEHGAYLLLLMHYWRTGPLPDNDAQLAMIAKTESRAWRTVGPVIRSFFSAHAGRLHQKRMDIERGRADAISATRAEVGSGGANSRWGSDRPNHRQNRSDRLTAARKLGTHTAEEWEALLDICGRRCARCGTETLGNPVKDHIKPLYQGGSDAIENLQPMCRHCNSSKGPDKTDYRPHGWRDKMPGKTPGKRLATDAENAWQNDCQTPGPSQSHKESSLSEESLPRARDPSEPPETGFVGPEVAAEMLQKLRKALKTYPPGRNAVRSAAEQADAVKPPAKPAHLTPEQLAIARRKRA